MNISFAKKMATFSVTLNRTFSINFQQHQKFFTSQIGWLVQKPFLSYCPFKVQGCVQFVGLTPGTVFLVLMRVQTCAIFICTMQHLSTDHLRICWICIETSEVAQFQKHFFFALPCCMVHVEPLLPVDCYVHTEYSTSPLSHIYRYNKQRWAVRNNKQRWAVRNNKQRWAVRK